MLPGGKYLPDALSYHRMTDEARCAFMPGEAGLAGQSIIKTLHPLKDQESF